jgi:hypothetical protein
MFKHDGAVDVPAAQREVVHPEHLHDADRWVGKGADQPQQAVPAGGHAQIKRRRCAAVRGPIRGPRRRRPMWMIDCLAPCGVRSRPQIDARFHDGTFARLRCAQMPLPDAAGSSTSLAGVPGHEVSYRLSLRQDVQTWRRTVRFTTWVTPKGATSIAAEPSAIPETCPPGEGINILSQAILAIRRNHVGHFIKVAAQPVQIIQRIDGFSYGLEMPWPRCQIAASFNSSPRRMHYRASHSKECLRPTERRLNLRAPILSTFRREMFFIEKTETFLN